MTPTGSPSIRTHALFEQRFEGDNALMELACERFLEAGMGAEMHAGTPDQLLSALKFRPGEATPVVVHLPREFNLVEEPCRQRIIDFSVRFAGQIDGMVLHDHASMAPRRSEYVAAAWKLEEQLEKIGPGPMVFVEYAAGLEPNDFAGFFEEILDLDRISACIDIGHVGIRAARTAYARGHGGEDVGSLKTQGPKLRQVISDVEQCVSSGAIAVLELIDALVRLHKPLHFHLHDGHPLSAFSPFGVSDHLSFFTEIPLNFEHNGRRFVPPMFGPAGLGNVVERALKQPGAGRLSFTLEIHPTGDRLALGDDSSLFERWSDKTNAEKMNHWLDVLIRNYELLRRALSPPPPPSLESLPAPTELIETPFECGPCDI